MTEQPELKPCPFCGGEADEALVKNDSDESWNEVFCTCCGVSISSDCIDWYESDRLVKHIDLAASVRSAWNTRT